MRGTAISIARLAAFGLCGLTATGHRAAVNFKPSLATGFLPDCPKHTPRRIGLTKRGWRDVQRKRKAKVLAYRQRKNRRNAR